MFYRLLVFLLGITVFSTCNSSKSLSNARINTNPALDCFNADCTNWVQNWSAYNQPELKLQLVQDGDTEKRFLQSIKDAYSIPLQRNQHWQNFLLRRIYQLDQDRLLLVSQLGDRGQIGLEIYNSQSGELLSQYTKKCPTVADNNGQTRFDLDKVLYWQESLLLYVDVQMEKGRPKSVEKCSINALHIASGETWELVDVNFNFDAQGYFFIEDFSFDPIAKTLSFLDGTN